MAEKGGRRPAVIGIVGGIGSGKSEVARALGAAGAVVSDSDAEAKAALRDPRVRETLVSWWGPRVLDEGGEVDRGVVASIVFADDAERRRLEALVHPLVHEARRRTLAEATASGAPALVVDAPLLLEAGVDRECDTLVFVDAAPEVRAARVLASRGWDEGELRRREAAQWPLDRKRAACAHAIENNSEDREDLARRAAELLDRLSGVVDPGR